MTERHILLVEDDEAISGMVSSYLSKEGYAVTPAYDGEAAVEAFRRERGGFDLVLLDLMLPKLGGAEVLRLIRAESLVPVLILSAKDGELDKALSLGFGADDYITKPFSMIELTARVQAAIRRAGYAAASATAVPDASALPEGQPAGTSADSGTQPEPRLLSLGSLTVDLDNYSAVKNGEPVRLTAKEFQILKLFAEHPGRVFTKAQVYAAVWQDAYYGDENVINVHMRRLREKIEEDPSKPEIIKTLWGIGYRLGESFA
ncbi:response regulator transcription factor [Paenibacillus spiritus]|uniref:Response regulator transcription factor n=1 Tax=Paenibacillus spiritus TaxID=2496557 RepID=A0A5J5FZP9_9BACL|nr:response regulator transcription factor [Paenibacillus spiritus]KAA8999655.1 response regulator transcription factor [Paenibacillus spiritus]